MNWSERCGEGRTPVAVQSVPGIGLVEQGLAHGIGHRTHQVGQRAAELPGRGQDLLAFIEGAVVAKKHGDDRHAGLGFGEERQVGLGLIRQGRAQVAVEAGDVCGLVQGVHDQAAQDLPNRVHAVLEGRHDTEVAAATPQRPEQVWFSVCAHGVKFGVGRRHVGWKRVHIAASLTPGQSRAPSRGFKREYPSALCFQLAITWSLDRLSSRAAIVLGA
jgi:hypothetical protein